MPFIENDEVKIHYAVWEEGTGPWVTLVNGYTRTLTDFRAMAKVLSEKGFRVLTFDNRGAGKTDSGPVFTLEDLANDILILWKNLGIERGNVLGISFGGVISAKFASLHPTKVEKLVLVSTPLNVDFLSKEVKGPSRDIRRLHTDMTHYFSESFAKKNKLLVDGFFRQTIKIFQESETALGARAQREALNEFNLDSDLEQILARTLILQGERDRIVSVDSARQLQKAIKGSQLIILPEIGHLLLVECPTEFYSLTSDFFNSN